MIAKVVKTKKEKEEAFLIRETVFIKEQNVAHYLEFDEFEDEAIHFIAYDEKIPIGAGRLRFVDGFAKVERLCILKEYRGKKIGSLLMKTIETEGNKQGYKHFKLNAQVQAIPFYEKLGYHNVSKKIFVDAGIPHVEMRKMK